MKKLSLLLILSSLFSAFIYSAEKKSKPTEEELSKMHAHIFEQRKKNLKNLRPMNTEQLAQVIAGTEFEKAGMSDLKMSQKQFHRFLHKNHHFAFAAASAFLDLKLLASHQQPQYCFNRKAAIEQSVGLSIELADKTFPRTF